MSYRRRHEYYLPLELSTRREHHSTPGREGATRSPVLKMATVIAVCLVAVYCFRFHFGPSGDEKVSYPPPPPPPPRHPLASTSTTVRICAAIHALRALEPNKPSNAPMPFQLLELDPLAPPFYPPRDSARPGTRYYDAVLREVIEAGKRVRTTAAAAATANQDQDPETRAERTMRAAWFVIDMLLDDEARCAFLDDVQPHLRSWSVATERIERLCGEVWERRQWTL